MLKKKIKIIVNKKSIATKEVIPSLKEEKIPASPTPILTPASSTVNKSKIYKKKPKLQKVEGLVPVFLLDTEHPDKYRIVDMENTWKDSIVQNIYIHQNCVARLHNFIFSDNKDLLLLQRDDIPEVGGWILGKQVLNKNSSKYEVSFERVVGIEAESQNTTQITFGTKAWSKVDMQLDVYADDELEIVGWFHTHPGWGVFLSRGDLNTHETIFSKPYQIAMVVDSINTPNEVGFFSRKANNEINNRDDLKNRYMIWIEFVNWLKE